MRKSRDKREFADKLMEENRMRLIHVRRISVLKDEVIKNVIETHRTIYEKKKLPVWQYKALTKFVLKLIDQLEDEVIYTYSGVGQQKGTTPKKVFCASSVIVNLYIVFLSNTF